MKDWRQRIGIETERDSDSIDDPIVLAWDTVARDSSTPLEGSDADAVAKLRTFLALDPVPSPSPTFFSDLEQRLVELYPPPVPSSPRVPGAMWSWSGNAHPAPARQRSTPRISRWRFGQGALAALAVMLVAGLIVLYQAAPGPTKQPAIPAAAVPKPTLETMAQFDFEPPLWGMPDATAWDHMEVGLFNVAPATSFTTDVPWYTSVDGPLSLTVLSGTLTVIPAGPALFYPANQSGQRPVELQAGERVTVGQDETIIYSATDGASGSNPGTVSALTLYGTVGPVDNAAVGIVPDDVSFIDFETAEPITPLTTKGATMTLQRLELVPFDTFVFEPAADLRYVPFFDTAQVEELHMEEGAIDGLVPEPGGRRIRDGYELRFLAPGPHTLSNLGDQTVEIYFLVVEPAPMPGTPTS